MSERFAERKALLRFRAFLRYEDISLRDLATVMGYNESYVSQVLGGIRPLSEVFRESMRQALAGDFLAPKEEVDEQIEALAAGYFV